MDVKIYTTPTCGYCRQAKSFLDGLGVEYTEYDVSRDRAAAEEMINLTGQMGVPVIVVDGEAVIGFDRVRLQTLLAGNGNRRGRIRFGLKIADAAASKKNGASAVSGALVGAVSSGLPGEKAGLKAGDIITEINRGRIGKVADAEKVLAGLKSGDIVTIRFTRNGENRKSEIVV
jgi:glutaredoxin 3